VEQPPSGNQPGGSVVGDPMQEQPTLRSAELVLVNRTACGEDRLRESANFWMRRDSSIANQESCGSVRVGLYDVITVFSFGASHWLLFGCFGDSSSTV
jgi:hypothetical protein